MKTLFISIICFITSYSANNMDERSFKVRPGGSINIKLNVSDIVINTWNRNEVLVNSDGDNEFKITQSSNSINILPAQPSSSHLRLNIPENFNINVINTAGELRINGNLKGDADINIQGGNVFFNDIYGNVTLSTGGGNIKGVNINGSIELKSFGGDINLGIIKGRTNIETGGGNISINTSEKLEQVKTSGGNIMIKTASGNGDVFTGGGNIEIGSCNGNLKLESLGGDIRISDAKGRTAVQTGSGTIRIKGLTGSIKAHTGSGDVMVNLTSGTNQSEIISGNGNVRINVTSNFKGKIIARAFDPEWWKDEVGNNESLKSDFKVSSLKRNKREQQIEAVYDINNGSTPIRVQTDHGTIIIRKN